MPFPLLPVLAAAQGLYGLYSSERAREQAGKLKLPSGYDITPEQQASYNRAQQEAKYGFAPEQEAQFQQNVASQQNLSYQRAMRGAGGNQWAGAVLAGVQAPQYGAFAQHAAQGSQLQQQKERYADQLGEQITAQRNRNTALMNQRYQMLQQAYGGAIKQGRENLMNAAWLAAGAYKGGAGTTGGTGDTTQKTGFPSQSFVPPGTTIGEDTYYAPNYSQPSIT